MGRKVTTKTVAFCKTCRNQHGIFFNVCFVEGLESIPSLEAIGKDIDKLTGKKREYRARDEFVEDSSGRVWTNVYPRSANPFAKNREAAEVAA